MSRAEYHREWALRNPDKVREKTKRYCQKNAETRRQYSREKMRQLRRDDPDGMRAKVNEWREANKERVRRTRRAYQVRTMYGMSPEEWDAMFAAQERRCAVCRREDSGDKRGRWHTDHCHQTGIVRGILCHHCNTMIGYGRDDPAVLRLAADYLDRSRR